MIIIIMIQYKFEKVTNKKKKERERVNLILRHIYVNFPTIKKKYLKL